MEYGLQLYSVRDITEKDLRGALEKVAAIGYKKVEFAGFFGNSATDVKAWLDNLGLEASGTHTQLQEVWDRFDATVAYHKAIDCHNLIIPYAVLKTAADVDDTVSKLNDLQPRLAKEGIALHYHNHSHEFLPNDDGVIPFEELRSRTGIYLEVDTYWAYVGGRDPVKLLAELGDRVKVIHIKDGEKDGHGLPLGRGTAPAKAVYDYCKKASLDMVVESETLTPDGVTEATICFGFLKEQEK